MKDDERSLVGKWQSGDREAFNALYRAYAHRVMGFALRLCGDRSEAEDLVQEVFLAAHAARSSFGHRARLLTWLLGIAVRRQRDNRRRRTVETVPAFEDEGAVGGAAPSRTLEEQVVERLALTEALERLDAPFREALLLVASQGLTYREAAEVLGEPVGTVKWRVSEAAKRIRRRIDEEECHELQPTAPRSARLPCGG